MFDTIQYPLILKNKKPEEIWCIIKAFGDSPINIILNGEKLKAKIKHKKDKGVDGPHCFD